MTAKVDFTSTKGTQRYRPRFINTVSDLTVEASEILGKRKGVLDISGRFVTFGSCFATNVARELYAHGAQKVFTACITEDVNCPFNNRLLLSQVFLGEASAFTDDLQAATGVDYAQMAHEFAEATDVIFTLGNIFRSPPGQYELTVESFEESRECIRDILTLLREHTRARLYVSVSPVPISGYRGSAFESVYEADCASKCQLRTALRSLDGYTYIPTFEIFRWLSAHQSFPTFGADNQNRRHIFPEQISAVIGLLT